jgi:hypothetical protein
MNRKIEIAIILFSNEGREINFRDLEIGESYLGNNESTPHFFWSAIGGFEVIVDGYKKVFRGIGFYVSLEAIKFLLQSLYWLEDRSNNFDDDEEFPKSFVTRFVNGDIVKLSKVDNETFEFSYLDKNLSNDSLRGKHYFLSELFSKQNWSSEVRIALKEYFDVLSSVLKEAEVNNETQILNEYLVKDWNNLS